MPDTMLGPAEPGHCWVLTIQRPERHNFRCKSADGQHKLSRVSEAGASLGTRWPDSKAGWAQDTLPWVGSCHGLSQRQGWRAGSILT